VFYYYYYYNNGVFMKKSMILLAVFVLLGGVVATSISFSEIERYSTYDVGYTYGDDYQTGEVAGGSYIYFSDEPTPGDPIIYEYHINCTADPRYCMSRGPGWLEVNWSIEMSEDPVTGYSGFIAD
jgi:hypothetical protein